MSETETEALVYRGPHDRVKTKHGEVDRDGVIEVPAEDVESFIAGDFERKAAKPRARPRAAKASDTPSPAADATGSDTAGETGEEG